ncbi:MAG: hypothetical protein SGBAC_008558 [Bacillariaceae sp.]
MKHNNAWALYDPITILPDGGGMPAMDGIIAYLDHPQAPTQIGVRLTGSSIGLGDHSGSVDGIEYFDCPLNSGVFCAPHQIEARTLSRIEQLRLKRELAAGQLDMSKGGIAGAAGYGMDSASKSSAVPVVRSSMIGSRSPSVRNNNSNSGGIGPGTGTGVGQAIPPREKAQSIAINGLSPTALAQLSKLNPGYLDPNAPVSMNNNPATRTTTTSVVPEGDEDEDEEMLVSEHEESSSEEEQQEEEYLKVNRQHISRLQQRKEEIQKRKLELQQLKNKGSSGSSSHNNTKTNGEYNGATTEEQPQQSAVVVTPSKGGSEDTTTTAAANTTATTTTATEEEEPSRPLSRLEQLKLKKRQLETTPSTTTPTTTTSNSSRSNNTTSTTPATQQPSTVANAVAMATAAAASQSADPVLNDSEQVPWPFPTTTRQVSGATSTLTAASNGGPGNTTATAPTPTGAALPESSMEEHPRQHPQQQHVEITEQPLIRLDQLKLQKRQLEEGDATPVEVSNKSQRTTSPVPPSARGRPEEPEMIQLVSLPPQPAATLPSARGRPEEQQLFSLPPQPAALLLVPPATTITKTPEESMDRSGAPPANGGNLLLQQQQQQDPTEMTVQIMNSSTKRDKELQLEISKDINLFLAAYDDKSVKQANVRKWGTSFVQQVKDKKSEIKCRVSLLSNPPPEMSNLPTNKSSMPMELTVEQLKMTSTDDLYNQYKDYFFPGRSKIQMLLLCQPIPSNGNGNGNGNGEDSNKLVTDLEVPPMVIAESVTVTVPAPAAAAPPTEPEKEEAPPTHIDRSSITSIASQLVDVKHQLRIKVINERTRYFKDLLVETSQQINLYEALYNNPAVKEAKVRKWNSTIVEQVRSGMAEIVCQICTIPNGKPEHLVKHGVLTIAQLKECSTTELYTRYAMDHYDLDNDQSLIQLVLKCQQMKTPVASNQAPKQGTLATPTRLETSLPPATPPADMSRGNPVMEIPSIEPPRAIYPRASPTEASQSSFSSMEKKPTNSPYAKAASAALPMHTTNTTFSDLLRDEQQQQQALASPNSVVPAMIPEQDIDVEMGPIHVPQVVTNHQPTKADAGVQTVVEVTTPIRDNRQPNLLTPQSRQQHQQQHAQAPQSFSDQLKAVDPYWWLAIIFILAAAFFAALFLGPISE